MDRSAASEPGQILVIDDDPNIRVMLSRLFRAKGYAVRLAKDGEEGLRMYEEEASDLVITDLIMPGQEGIETIVRLRKLDPEVLIVAMSGGGFCRPDTYLKAAESLGARRVFQKPVDSQVLLDAVAELLAG